MAVQRLFHKELAEVRRVWRRLTQQKRVFAVNISVRKTAVSLARANSLEQIVAMLESCLKSDFSGMELQLASRQALGLSSISKSWRQGNPGRAMINLCIRQSNGDEVGSLLLYRNSATGWLVDTELLKRELCVALATALQNCIEEEPSPINVPPTVKSPYAHNEAFGD